MKQKKTLRSVEPNFGNVKINMAIPTYQLLVSFQQCRKCGGLGLVEENHLRNGHEVELNHWP
jgi:hypothetical protein